MCTHIQTYKHTYTQTCTHTHTYAQIYTHVCIRAHIHRFDMHQHIHSYIFEFECKHTPDHSHGMWLDTSFSWITSCLGCFPISPLPLLYQTSAGLIELRNSLLHIPRKRYAWTFWFHVHVYILLSRFSATQSSINGNCESVSQPWSVHPCVLSCSK